MEAQNNKDPEIHPDLIQPRNIKSLDPNSRENTRRGTAEYKVARALSSANYIQGSEGWKMDSNGEAMINNPVPASASAYGLPGMIAWDSSYIYVCTAVNTWKRVAIATW